MNNRWGLLAVALTLIALGGALVLVIVPAPPTPLQMATTSSAIATSTSSAAAGIADLITVSAPLPEAAVSSTTLVVTGEARGSWYFEASFPVELLDATGTSIARGPAQAQSEWMTDSFVPFTASLSYPPQPAGSRGTLLLKNDNPSGDPSKGQEVSIPVVFN